MIIKHNGYLGKVEFDEDAEIFHGEILNIKDVVTFQGRTAKELKKAFSDSLKDYLAFCKKLGQEPQKPFSGRFVLRVSPELHTRLSTAAAKEDKSLNQWVVEKLEKAAA